MKPRAGRTELGGQGHQDANAIEMLRRGAEVLEPHGLVMVMEPLNFRDPIGKESQLHVMRGFDAAAWKI